MTPEVNIFENVFPGSSTGHRNAFRDQIWWKLAVAKLPKGRVYYHTKKLGLRGTRLSPYFAQNGPIAPKIPWTLSPLDMSTYRLPHLVRIGCALLNLFHKDWFVRHLGLTSCLCFLRSHNVDFWIVDRLKCQISAFYSVLFSCEAKEMPVLAQDIGTMGHSENIVASAMHSLRRRN